MWSDNETLGIVGCQVITTALEICIMLIEHLLPLNRLLKISLLCGSLKQCKAGTNHCRKIGCQPWQQQLATAPGMAKPVILHHRSRNENESSLCCVEPIRNFEAG